MHKVKKISEILLFYPLDNLFLVVLLLTPIILILKFIYTSFIEKSINLNEIPLISGFLVTYLTIRNSQKHKYDIETINTIRFPSIINIRNSSNKNLSWLRSFTRTLHNPENINYNDLMQRISRGAITGEGRNVRGRMRIANGDLITDVTRMQNLDQRNFSIGENITLNLREDILPDVESLGSGVVTSVLNNPGDRYQFTLELFFEDNNRFIYKLQIKGNVEMDMNNELVISDFSSSQPKLQILESITNE